MTSIFARVDHARIGGSWVTDAVVELSPTGTRLVPDHAAPPRIRHRIQGVLVPPLTDTHVHLGLTDAAESRPSSLGRVLDLGWAPKRLPALLDAAHGAHRGLDARFAGPLHAAPGGYPLGSGWAPAGAVVEVPDADAAARAVRDCVAAGASAVKVTMNVDFGPVPSDEVLSALVAEAAAACLPLAAHVQGEGQAERAIAAGVAVLAHTPWTEALPDDLIEQAAATQTWISTLAMHRRDGDDRAFTIATDNLARFAAAGGAVAYGTDLGNGLARFDIDPHEVDALRLAGIDGTGLVDALLAEGLLPPGSTVCTVDADVTDDATLLTNLHRVRALPYTWFSKEDE